MQQIVEESETDSENEYTLNFWKPEILEKYEDTPNGSVSLKKEKTEKPDFSSNKK